MKLFHAFSCVLVSFLENFLHSIIFFICGPTKIPALIFASDSLGNRSWRYLNAADSLSIKLGRIVSLVSVLCAREGTTLSWDPEAAPI